MGSGQENTDERGCSWDKTAYELAKHYRVVCINDLLLARLL